MSAVALTSRFSRLALACTLVLSAAPYANAQSLQELYDTARGYDATYLAARALADSAQYKAAQVHALRRPGFNATAGITRDNVDSPGGDFNSTSRSVGLNATQSLFNRANDRIIEQADLGIEISTAELQFAEQELIIRVAQAYFDVLVAQDALGTAKASKAAISEQLASAKRNFQVGTATITDTREAQARYDLATALEIGADNDLLTKRITLDQLVGRTGVQPRPLAVPVALPPVTPMDVNDWVTYTNSAPSVRRTEILYEVAKLETSRARAGHLPTVGLTGNLTRNDISGNNPSRTNGFNTTTGVGVQLNLPLFSGFSVQNRIRETLSLEEQSRNNLEAERRKVAQATRQFFFGVQSLQAQVKAFEAAEASSQVALEATQLGYRVGVKVNLDVLNAQSQLFTTRRDLTKARYDVVVNSLRLRQAAGQLSPADVTAVDTLIAK